MKPTIAPFPSTRLRRPRATPALRALVREMPVTPDDFIWPVFVRDGVDVVEPVASMLKARKKLVKGKQEIVASMEFGFCHQS